MKLTSSEHQHLILSDAAYQKSDAEREAKKIGWQKMKRYSNGEINVYVKGNRCVVAYRGTQSGKDLKTDIKSVALNANRGDDRRFKEAQNGMKQLLKNVGGHYKIQVTGHSLGGTIAQYVGRLFCLGGTSFNPGSTPLSGLTAIMKKAAKLGEKYRHSKHCAKVKIIRITDGTFGGSDWVSQNAEKNFTGSKAKHLKPKNPASIKNNLTLANHFTPNLYQ